MTTGTRCPVCPRDVVAVRTEPRLVYEHAEGACRPLCVDEAHSLRCPDCGRDVPFRLHASPRVRRSAGTLRCACGVQWKLEAAAGGVGVYVEAA